MTMTRTPTNRELTRRQAGAGTDLAGRPGGGAEAVDGGDDRGGAQQGLPARGILDEVAPSGIAGRLIKFTKDGDYVTSDDEQVVPADAEFILLADDTSVGWMKFNGAGEAPEKVMGLLFDGFEMPPRESLGDLDPKAVGARAGQPAAGPVDCISRTSSCRTPRRRSCSPSRRRRRPGGARSDNLLRHYERMQRTRPDELPVIRLGKGGFKHKDSRVGWVDTPVFVVVGRAPRDSAAKPDTSIGAFLERRDRALASLWPSVLEPAAPSTPKGGLTVQYVCIIAERKGRGSHARTLQRRPGRDRRLHPVSGTFPAAPFTPASIR